MITADYMVTSAFLLENYPV